MTGSQIPYAWMHGDYSVKDPGASGTIDTGKKGIASCAIRTAAAETRTVQAPERAMQQLFLSLDVDAGDCTISVKNSNGFTTSTIVFADAGDWARLTSFSVGGVLTWKVEAASGAVSATTAKFQVPLTSFRVHDACATNLPGTAANDDMGLVTGTPGTNALTLQGVDFGGTSTDEKARCEFTLPANYVAGGDITVRLSAGMITAQSDGTATVDCEVWNPDTEGGSGSDLCTTAAQSINDTTFANFNFTITPTGLVAGDRLEMRLSFAGSDTGNAAVMIPAIANVEIRYAAAA